jgi:glycosyltransferase involved in cell wall biosynthesis
MDDNPLVSILIPCYNNEKYVGEAIESALNQSYPKVEVIVVDDGSADGSLEVIKSYGARIAWRTGFNRGACAARNTAFKLSKGKFIQFLDADDILLPMKIEKQLPDLLSGLADVVVCKGALFGDGRPDRPIKKPTPDPAGFDPVEYVIKFPLGTERPLYRRTFVEMVHGYRENVPRGQDWDFNVRIAAAGARFSLVDEILVRHRHHDSPTRITRQKFPLDYTLKMTMATCQIISCPPYQVSKKARQIVAKQITNLSIYAYRNGFRESASTGFLEAKKWWPQTIVEERLLYRFLARFLSLTCIEFGLDVCRKSRNNFKRFKIREKK